MGGRRVREDGKVWNLNWGKSGRKENFEVLDMQFFSPFLFYFLSNQTKKKAFSSVFLLFQTYHKIIDKWSIKIEYWKFGKLSEVYMVKSVHCSCYLRSGPFVIDFINLSVGGPVHPWLAGCDSRLQRSYWEVKSSCSWNHFLLGVGIRRVAQKGQPN